MLAIVYNNPAPYFSARLVAAGRTGALCAAPLFGQGSREDGRALFEEKEPAPSPAEIVARVEAFLDGLCPDVVALHGWSRRSSLAALRWAATRRTPTVMLGDFQAYGRRHGIAENHVKRRLLRFCGAFLVGGSPHAEFLSGLGLPRDRIFTGYDVVDNAHFSQGAQLARSHEPEARARLELPPKYFLAVGRLAPEKNPLFVMDAYARYLADTRPSGVWPLVIVGDGPLREVVVAHRNRLGLERHVRLVGLKSYDELPAYYGLASVFVHASTRDSWGLVVNEALAAGLPALVSKQSSCMPDLVRDGVNGYAFDPRDAGALARHFNAASTGQYDLNVLGRCGRELISGWSPDTFAERLWHCAALAGSAIVPQVGIADNLFFKALIFRPGAPD